MIYAGIDPGLTGAIALIRPPELFIGAPMGNHRVEFWDTPTLQVRSGKTIKNVMNPAGAVVLLEAIRPDHVIIEKAQAMPGQGVTSMFSFGMGFGIWIGILAALKIPYEQVHPATWKAKMMGGMTKDKDASRIRALQLFPLCAGDLKLKKHHGRADALLLAAWGSRDNHYP